MESFYFELLWTFFFFFILFKDGILPLLNEIDFKNEI